MKIRVKYNGTLNGIPWLDVLGFLADQNAANDEAAREAAERAAEERRAAETAAAVQASQAAEKTALDAIAAKQEALKTDLDKKLADAKFQVEDDIARTKAQAAAADARAMELARVAQQAAEEGKALKLNVSQCLEKLATTEKQAGTYKMLAAGAGIVSGLLLLMGKTR